MTVVADFTTSRATFTLAFAATIEPGSVVAVIGPNGAGKSTLLRALAGLQGVDTGQVSIGGAVVDDGDVFVPPQGRSVGVVFQDYALFPHLSVLENVAFGPRSRGVSRDDARRRASLALDSLDIGVLAARKPSGLSGGQAQRVALARALASGPRLLLLDEPLSALDAGTRGEVRTDLRQHLTSFAGPTLVVTHDAVEAMVLADSLLVLEGGRAVQRGTPAQVARRPATTYVARLLGLNLWPGDARSGDVALRGGSHLVVADTSVAGHVLVAVRPAALGLHLEPPGGSPRNAWQGTVSGLELLGDRVRVAVDGAPPALVDVTPAAVSELGVRAGLAVWMTLKATEAEVYPAP